MFVATESGSRRGDEGFEPRRGGDQFALRTIGGDGDDRVTVLVEGELDLATVDQLTQLLHEQLSRQRPVILDMSGVRFIDSTGLAAILGALRRHEDDGGVLRIGGELQPQVRRLMELTGVLDLLEEHSGP